LARHDTLARCGQQWLWSPTTPSELKRRSCEHSMRSCCSHDELSFVALFGPVGSSFRTRAAPRHQLAVFQKNAPPRLRLQRSDRFLRVLWTRWWPGWRRSLHIVRPDTGCRLAPQRFRVVLDAKITVALTRFPPSSNGRVRTCHSVKKF
jgi:hypothetical protein